MRVERETFQHGDGNGAVGKDGRPGLGVKAAGIAHKHGLTRDGAEDRHGQKRGHIPLTAAINTFGVQNRETETAGGLHRVQKIKAAHGNTAEIILFHKPLEGTVDMQGLFNFRFVKSPGFEERRVFIFGVATLCDLVQQLCHINGDKAHAELVHHGLGAEVAGNEPVGRLADAAEVLAPERCLGPMGVYEGPDTFRHFIDIAVEDFAASAMLFQKAQNFHGSRQRIAVAAGEDIAVAGLELLKYLKEKTFAAAGSNIEQGEVICKVLLERDFLKLFTQRIGKRIDKTMHPLFRDLGEGTFDLIIISHRQYLFYSVYGNTIDVLLYHIHCCFSTVSSTET